MKGRLLLALFVFLTGCASIPSGVRELAADARSIELTDVPFYAQERYQCGPAALATALDASGADVDLDDLVGRVYVPQRRGSFQVELLAATRTSDRIPYVIDGTLSALHAELAAGRPVIVLQNLGVGLIPKWHYAVVVGIDLQTDDVVLRSGVVRRRVTSLTTFLRTWRRSDYWAMVVLRPGELPARVDRGRYVEAVAALEQAGRAETAISSWEAALARWPDDPVALFGLANAALAAGRHADAEQRYRRLLDVQPGNAAGRNNLALALARQGRFAEALQEIERALATNSDPAIAAELEKTRADILEASQRTD